MLNIEKYKEELLNEFAKGNHLEQCVHEVGFRHGAFQPKTGVNIIYIGEFLDWLCEEHKEPILTDEEKDYLSAVIKPFKNNVEYIKRNDVDGWRKNDRIIITLGGYDNQIKLPEFEHDSMYKNMELYKPYTLEELGLC